MENFRFQLDCTSGRVPQHAAQLEPEPGDLVALEVTEEQLADATIAYEMMEQCRAMGWQHGRYVLVPARQREETIHAETQSTPDRRKRAKRAG